MNIIITLYTEVLYRPLFNALVGIYTILPWQDMGLAIILLTLGMRIILAPLFWKAQKSQKDLAKIQPELKKVQQEFKHDREKQGRALMELYAKHRVNPMSGCLIALVQLPLLIALFSVFRHGFDPSQLVYLYSFIENPGALNPQAFWGILDLARGGIQGLLLGIGAAATQYVQTKMTLPAPPSAGDKHDFSRIIQTQSLYVFPLFILVWSYTLPLALTLYWTVLNIFGILQEVIVRRLRK